MHVFLSEYLTCGALAASAALKPSLAIEGAAMLRALAEDAVAVGYEVSITWDADCGDFRVPGAVVHATKSAADEQRVFRELAGTADVTLVIAPEFDRILEQRCRLITTCGGRSAGSSPQAVALCADKLRLAEHLSALLIATISTSPCPHDLIELKGDAALPLVVKPRCGAGSLHAFVLTNEADVTRAAEELAFLIREMEFIAQPYIAGQALSVAGIVSGQEIEMFPPCTQNIRGDRLQYSGGTVPARIDRVDDVVATARRAISTVEGLHGYVGVDLILPDDGPPVVVEINPRLTSSYHGYRKIAATNLAPRILESGVARTPVAWRDATVTFFPDGTADSVNHRGAERRRRTVWDQTRQS